MPPTGTLKVRPPAPCPSALLLEINKDKLAGWLALPGVFPETASFRLLCSHGLGQWGIEGMQ